MRSGGRRPGINGSDVRDDGFFGRADKPGLAHDYLNDVDGSPGVPVEPNAELAGEVIESQVPAVERLQNQDLLNRGLRLARRRTDRQQDRQQRSLPSAIEVAIRMCSACPAHGVLRSPEKKTVRHRHDHGHSRQRRRDTTSRRRCEFLKSKPRPTVIRGRHAHGRPSHRDRDLRTRVSMPQSVVARPP